MIEAKKIHERKMQEDPEYAREYEALEEEFSFLRKMILARKRAGAADAWKAGCSETSRMRSAKRAPWRVNASAMRATTA